MITPKPASRPALRPICAAALLLLLPSWCAPRLLVAQAAGTADYAVAKRAAGHRDWDAAAAAMERAVHASPTNAEYHYWLGKAYSGQASVGSLWVKTRVAGKIIRSWERALVLDSAYDAVYEELIPVYAQVPRVAGGSESRAAELLARWLRIHPYRAGLAQVRFDIARNLPAQTLAHATALATAFPDSARPLAELALAYQRLSRVAEAWQIIDRGLTRWPTEPYLLFALGRAAAETGERVAHGEQALRQVIGATAGVDDLLRANARYRLGTLLERRGAVSAARVEYQGALALAPKLRGARTALERVQ